MNSNFSCWCWSGCRYGALSNSCCKIIESSPIEWCLITKKNRSQICNSRWMDNLSEHLLQPSSLETEGTFICLLIIITITAFLRHKLLMFIIGLQFNSHSRTTEEHVLVFYPPSSALPSSIHSFRVFVRETIKSKNN